MGLWVVLYSFLSAGAVSLALTPRIRDFALKRNIIDNSQSSRKIHKTRIPRLGGLAIFTGTLAGLGVALATGLADLQSPLLTWPKVVGLLVGGMMIAGLGLVDDLRGVRPRTKLCIQLIVSVFVVAIGFRIDKIAIPFSDPIPLGYLGLPLTVFWIVGIINALNLIDGLDGLAGGVALIGAITNLVLVGLRGDVLSMALMATLAGAIMGFLFYNFHPASIFMGDTGSMFLGYSLATTSLIASTKSATTVAFFVPIVMLGLPILDTLFAMLRRSIRGRPMFSADKEHIHHILLNHGLSHRSAVLTLYAVASILSAAAIFLSLSDSRGALVTLGLLAALGILAARAVGFGRIGLTEKSTAEIRAKNRIMYSAVAAIKRELRHAASSDHLNSILDELCEALGATAATLSLSGRVVSKAKRAISTSTEPPLQTRHRIHTSAGEAQLLIEWPRVNESFDRDKEIAIERLEPSIAQALGRIIDAAQPRRAAG